MYARVSKYEAPAEQVEAALERFEDGIDALRQMSGIKRAYLLVDREGGNALTVTVWESKEAMDASAEAAKRLRSEAMEAAGGSVVSVETYELVAQEEF